MAKKKGPVLYELLRKDHAEKRWQDTQKETPGSEPEAVVPQEAPATEVAAEPPASRMDAPQEDADGLVFHLTRHQAMLVIGAAAVVLVVVVWIGLRMGGSADAPASSGQMAQDTSKATADGDLELPLSLVRPEPTGEPNTDSPIKILPPSLETLAAKGGSKTVAEKPAGKAVAEAEDETGEAAAKVGPLAKGDMRKAGLRYVVIQNIQDSPEAQAHAAEVRKFLASKGVRTLQVAGLNGGLKIVSEQGFDFDSDPAEKDKAARLIEAVKKLGKEYATAKYAGRYDFRDPYTEKHKGN